LTPHPRAHPFFLLTVTRTLSKKTHYFVSPLHFLLSLCRKIKLLRNMNKRRYSIPACETIDLELQQVLCESSFGGNGIGDVTIGDDITFEGGED
jgi:hypothetical protein